MNPEIKDSSQLTNESWRPKFYGLIQEGRKLRVSSQAIKTVVFITGILVFAINIFSSVKPSFKKSAIDTFAPPAVRADDAAVYVPPVMDAVREAEIERRRAREGSSSGRRPVIVERIRPVSLSQLEGIPTGSEVFAQLSSGGTNGMIKAALTEHLKVSGEVLLPSGTVLIGKGSSSDERLYVSFVKAILPDKSEQKVRAYAYDQKDRIIGLKGKKISDYAFRLTTSAGLIFLGGMADGMREDRSSNPFDRRRPTTRDAALNGVATATTDLSKEIMEGMKDKQERVEVAHSTRILVIFGDLDDSER